MLSSAAHARQWEKVLGGAEWPARTLHSLTFFNDAWFQLGGNTTNTGATGHPGTWKSIDGATWTPVLHTQESTGDVNVYQVLLSLRGHTATVFNGEIWLLGGDDGNAYSNAVAHSADGENWFYAPAPPWGPRAYHQSFVFDNKLWILGGESATPPSSLNDVWYTEDGTTWTQATAAAPWTSRLDFGGVATTGKMYIFGGSELDQGTFDYVDLDDVWSSTDGVNWTQETAAAPWGARFGAATIVLNDTILLAGGFAAGARKNDVWSSTDGQNWTEVTAAAPWPARTFAAMALGAPQSGPEILLTGGSKASSVRYDDVWASADGQTWTRRSTPGAPWAGPIMEGRPQLYSFNGQVWSLAKSFVQAPDPPAERLWSSPDGEDWVLAASNFPWETMVGTITEFQGKVWALGAQLSDSSYRICSSVDGINWTTASTTGWNGGYAIAAAVQGGTLWALVEQWNESFTERVVELRRSSNGLTWTTVTPTGSSRPEWNNQYAASSMLSYFGRLYVSVNYVDSVNGQYVDERGVWSSTDGINWTRVTEPYAPGPGPDNVEPLGLIGVAHDRMWAWGPGGSIWSSADGGVWFPIGEPLQPIGGPAAFTWFQDHLWVKTIENGGLADDLFAFSPFIHVNFSHTGAEEGTLPLPYNTLTEAVDAAFEDQQIQLAPGTNGETMLITKRLRLTASGGTARIGAGGAKQSVAIAVQAENTPGTGGPLASGVRSEDQYGFSARSAAGDEVEARRTAPIRRPGTSAAGSTGPQEGQSGTVDSGSGGNEEDEALSNVSEPFGGCIGGAGVSRNWWKALGDLFTLLTGFGILVFMGRMGGSGRD